MPSSDCNHDPDVLSDELLQLHGHSQVRHRRDLIRWVRSGMWMFWIAFPPETSVWVYVEVADLRAATPFMSGSIGQKGLSLAISPVGQYLN